MRPAEQLRWLVVRPPVVIAGAIVTQWLTTIIVALRADSLDIGPGSLFNVTVLGPLALVCAFRIAASAGGLALGSWTLLVWVALPWLAPAFTLAKYDSTLREYVLPIVLGLTGDAGYAEGVAILAVLALLVRRSRVATALAGLTLIALAIVWARRTSGIDSLTLDALQLNMAGLREYFWSQRVLQWLPFAGIVAVARRSPALAIALGGWLGAFVGLRLTSTGATFDDGEFFRLLLPALPAYVLLVAALPLLVPTLAGRLGPLAQPVESR